MRVFRKLFFSTMECCWYKLFYDSSTDTWDLELVEGSQVSAALVELDTLFPEPGFSWQTGYGMEFQRPGYVFDKAANPS